MALEYMLRIATNLKPSEVLDFLSSALGLEADSEQVSGPGVIIYASTESERGRSIIEDAFHFSPTIRMTFRLDKFEDTELGRNTLLQATLELLQQTNSDAVLLFNNEEVVLLSVGSRLILNKNNSFWISSRLSQVISSYEMGSIPSL